MNTDEIKVKLLSLTQLKLSEGWKVMMSEVEDELKEIDSILLGQKKNETELSLEMLRERRIGIAIMKDRIDLMINSYQQQLEPTNLDVQDLDPYNNIVG